MNTNELYSELFAYRIMLQDSYENESEIIREIKNYFDSFKGEKILFIKRDNFSYYWRLILFITTIIYFLFSICCFIFYDMDTIENKALFLVFFIFSTRV